MVELSNNGSDFSRLLPRRDNPCAHSLPSRRDHSTVKVPAVDEQNAFRFEGVAHGLHASGQDRLARLKTGNCALADARGISKILSGPVERRPRHSALNHIQLAGSLQNRLHSLSGNGRQNAMMSELQP